jgi:hypothetical protein
MRGGGVKGGGVAASWMKSTVKFANRRKLVEAVSGKSVTTAPPLNPHLCQLDGAKAAVADGGEALHPPMQRSTPVDACSWKTEGGKRHLSNYKERGLWKCACAAVPLTRNGVPDSRATSAYPPSGQRDAGATPHCHRLGARRTPVRKGRGM